MKSVDTFINICIDNGYITQEHAPWLRYGIEKRITTLLVTIPMLIVGCLLSSAAMTLSFYFSFCFLRSRTNGFHAKSFGGCLIFSLLTEAFALGVLSRVWDETIASILLIASTISIYALAPYNHPNMDLSQDELVECAQSAKRRLFTLILFMVVLYMLRFHQMATGILSGIVVVAVTLIFAYVPKD